MNRCKTHDCRSHPLLDKFLQRKYTILGMREKERKKKKEGTVRKYNNNTCVAFAVVPTASSRTKLCKHFVYCSYLRYQLSSQFTQSLSLCDMHATRIVSVRNCIYLNLSVKPSKHSPPFQIFLFDHSALIHRKIDLCFINRKYFVREKFLYAITFLHLVRFRI